MSYKVLVFLNLALVVLLCFFYYLIGIKSERSVTLLSLTVNVIFLFIGINALLISYLQLQHSLDQGKEEREKEKAQQIQNNIGLLRSLLSEIKYNKEIFNEVLLGKNEFTDGHNIHFMDYSVNALTPNIARNTF